jgi:hypothetical protein
MPYEVANFMLVVGLREALKCGIQMNNIFFCAASHY